MSKEVKRYSINEQGRLVERENGALIMYDELAQLQARNEEMEKELEAWRSTTQHTGIGVLTTKMADENGFGDYE